MNTSDNFIPENTTVWSFPERGKWATHSGKYRGNFAPQIAKNIILKYSKKSDIVLDPMAGSGTTLIECRLLERNAVGIDINPFSVDLIKNNLKFENPFNTKQEVFVKNAQNLDFIKSESIDLVIIHPPYLNIIKYSENIENDLSLIGSVEKYLIEFDKIVKELFRTLKQNSHLAVLIGDTRKHKHYIPLSFYVMNSCLKCGFVLKEDIIKIQHNCYSTPYWRKKSEQYNFYLILHEHLFIFRKPEKGENLSHLKYSAFYTHSV